jgi:hypothetical protein
MPTIDETKTPAATMEPSTSAGHGPDARPAPPKTNPRPLPTGGEMLSRLRTHAQQLADAVKRLQR